VWLARNFCLYLQCQNFGPHKGALARAKKEVEVTLMRRPKTRKLLEEEESSSGLMSQTAVTIFPCFSLFNKTPTESEDEVRVVHSKKDRSWNSMRDSIKRMRSAMKINDWSIILDEFRVTNKIIDNSKMLILTHGIPKFYIKMLADLEDFLNVSLKDKEGMKKMKKEVAKSFNKMKLDLRKHNKTYETQIAACRANPSEYVEESSESESESESEESESESSESSEASSEASEQSSEESESEDDAKPAVKPPAAKPAASKPASSKVSLFLYLHAFMCPILSR
jgi:hypothetical protein